jgi:alpha-1,6-mannosyltransferase
MRILQVANFVTPTSGGLRTTIDSLRVGYERRGWHVFRITPFAEPDHRVVIDEIPSLRVPMMHGYRAIVGRRIVKDAVTVINPDIIEMSDTTTFAWLPKWAQSQGIPCVVISHERTDIAVSSVWGLSFLLRRVVKNWKTHIARYATAVVCASRFAAQEFAHTDCEPVIIPLGTTPYKAQMGREYERNEAVTRIAMCGRLSPEKAPRIAFEAVRHLSRTQPVEFVVIGDGPMRPRLQHEFDDLNVDFRGFVSNRDEVFQELASADVVVNLGPIETFGLVTVEALACGTPVVVANSGASRDIISDECGRSVPLDPTQVALAVLELLEQSGGNMSEKCRRVASRFTWDRTVESFSDLHLSLVDRATYVSN